MTKRQEVLFDGETLEEMKSSGTKRAKREDLSQKLWFPWLRDGTTRSKAIVAAAGLALAGVSAWIGNFHSEPTHLARATGGDVVEAGAKTGAGIGTGGCLLIRWVEEVAHGHPFGALAAANACADHTFSSGAATIPIVKSAPKDSEACPGTDEEFDCPSGYVVDTVGSREVDIYPPDNSKGSVQAQVGRVADVDGREVEAFVQTDGTAADSTVTGVSLYFPR